MDSGVVRDVAAAPQVSVSAKVQSDYIALTWSAPDPGSGLDTCELQVNMDEEGWTPLPVDCVDATTTYTDFQAGHNYGFRLQATDRVGNAAEDSASLLYNGDPPQVSVTATFSDDHIDVTWNATDPGSGVNDYDLQVRVDAGDWVTLLTDSQATSCTYPADYAHSYAFRVTATDNVGNVGQGEVSATMPNAVTKYYYLGGRRERRREQAVLYRGGRGTHHRVRVR